MSILLTLKSIWVKRPLQSVHSPMKRGWCVCQKELTTLQPVVQTVILSAYADLKTWAAFGNF